MFCPSCGASVNQSKSFCNICGAKLPGTKGEGQELSIGSLVWAIVAIYVIGVGTAFGMMAMMKKFGFDEGAINGFTLLIFLLTAAVEGAFLWLLLSRMRGTREVSPNRLREQITNEVSAARTRGLPEAVPSVTEDTTHRLAPALRNEPKIGE